MAIPHIFTPDTRILADDVNANFSYVDGKINGQASGLFPIEYYGDPATSFDTTFQAAVNAAVPSGGTVVLQAGVTYQNYVENLFTDIPVNLEGNGATIVRNALLSANDHKSIKILHNYKGTSDIAVFPADAVVVNSITIESITIDGGTQNSVSVLNCPPGSIAQLGAARLTVLKVFSQDLIPWSIDSQFERCSEILDVYTASYDGGTNQDKIYLFRIIRVPMSTNIKVVAHRKYPISIQNLFFEDASSNSIDTSNSLLEIVGAVEPELYNITCKNGDSTFVDLIGCSHSRTEKVWSKQLNTEGSLNQFGYNLVDSGSCDSYHVNPQANHLRHGYTTRAYTVDDLVADEIWKYGGAVGPYIQGGFGNECGFTFADVHPDCCYGVFDGLRASVPYKEGQGAAYCFSARGWRNTYLNIVGEGPLFFQANITQTGGEITLVNPMFTRLPGYDTSNPPWKLSSDGTNGRRAVTIMGGKTIADFNTEAIFECNSVSLDILDHIQDTNPQDPSNSFNFELTDSRVYARASVIDFRRTVASSINPRIAIYRDAVSSFMMDGGTVFPKSGEFFNIADLGSFAIPAGAAIARNVNIIDGRIATAGGYTLATNAVSPWCSLVYNGGATTTDGTTLKQPNITHTTYTAAGGTVSLTFPFRGEDYLYVALKMTVSGTKSFTVDSAPPRDGMRLFLTNAPSSNASAIMAIVTSTVLPLGSTINLAAGSGASFISSGGVYIRT